MIARTITNPANNSALSSSVIRNELQTLENEIAAFTPNTETPSGVINGSNVTFTTAKTINAVYGMWMNGEFVHPVQYSSTGTTITFVSAPLSAFSGLPFTIVYI